MSLSSWLRDYLYVPLGGNRGGALRTYRNLLLTMVLGGIWHGAAWKFVIWGALHGGFLALERALGGRGRQHTTTGGAGTPRPLWRRALAVLGIFHFVCVCWIFFRAEGVTRAVEMLAAIAAPSTPAMLLTPWLAILIVIGMAVQFTSPDLIEKLDGIYQKLPVWVVGLLAGCVLLAVELVGGDETAAFIYFQF
jgi:D-alanyl-lipoteichoic acid acyltransferase DltB (MBOAT superfamily)